MAIPITYEVEFLKPLVEEALRLAKQIGFANATMIIAARERKTPEQREILRSEISSICSRLRRMRSLDALLEKIRDEQQESVSENSFLLESLRRYFASEGYLRDIAAGHAGDNPDDPQFSRPEVAERLRKHDEHS